MQSCSNTEQFYIVVGSQASRAELLTVEHFKKDLETVCGESFSVVNAGDQLPDDGFFFVVGTSDSNELIQKLIRKKDVVLSENFPGKRGGVWAKVALENGQPAIVLAGADIQGTQYAVYDYCSEILGVDPFQYWTGKKTTTKHVNDLLVFDNKVIAPPQIPILCYFENDVDELANRKDPLLEYDWESYTEMINSLVRNKYNAIQFFDMLGRPEFFLREEYKAIRPDYDIRISYIDSMIDYAHDMGMMVQIDLSLGYKIRPMEQEKADCWSEYKDEWIANWKYYFEETPLGKADIFSLRPRNQVWDWEYQSSCGENKVDVFNEVYVELGELIDQYKPGAPKIAICYSDGMEMFNNGFNPPKDWIVVWSDDGWGGFKMLPDSTKGYQFGTYMHAGYWLNHTVHDPYPEKLDSIMKMMCRQFQATSYCQVNGQQFRPFLINIEAFSKIADNPEAFDGNLFYTEWTQRYFGDNAAAFAVQSMKKLHEAQFSNIGYVEHLWEIREAVAYLSNLPIVRPGKPSIPNDYKHVEDDYDALEIRTELLVQAREQGARGAEYVPEDDLFYHDYIQLPVELYLDLLAFESSLHQMAKYKREFEKTNDTGQLKKALDLLGMAKADLDAIYKRCAQGDKNDKWKGWYDPAKRRPNNGFPSIEMLDAIEANLRSLK